MIWSDLWLQGHSYMYFRNSAHTGFTALKFCRILSSEWAPSLLSGFSHSAIITSSKKECKGRANIFPMGGIWLVIFFPPFLICLNICICIPSFKGRWWTQISFVQLINQALKETASLWSKERNWIYAKEVPYLVFNLYLYFTFMEWENLKVIDTFLLTEQQ